MKSKRDDKKEKVTDVKGTIVGFTSPDPVEKTQEEEIQEFKLKKDERELAKLSDAERKEKEKKFKEEEERVEKAKSELLVSIRKRIPAIEKRFKLVVAPIKKGKVVENVKSNSRQKIVKKDKDLPKEQENSEKERE